MCMGGGGGGGGNTQTTQTTTQTSEPWSGLKPYLENVYREGWNLVNAPGPYAYPYSVIPERSAQTLASQDMRTQYGMSGAGDYAVPATAAWYQSLNAPNVVNSPWAQGAIEATVAPVTRQLMTEVLPNIGSQAVMQGAYTGNRYPLTQALAIEGATRSMMDAAQSAMLPLYTSGLEASGRAQAMTPLMQSAPLFGANLLSQVGGEVEGYQGQLAQEAAQKYEYEQQLPYVKLANFANLIQGGGGVGGTSTGTTTGTQSQGQSSDPMSSALGGLMLAALLFPGGFCDRRLKRDVRRIGALANGLPIYSFRYLWDDQRHIGPMADEVLAVNPDAVSVVGGYLFVHGDRL